MHSVFVRVVSLVSVLVIVVHVELFIVRRIVTESAIYSVRIVKLVVKVEVLVGIVIGRVIFGCE